MTDLAVLVFIPHVGFFTYFVRQQVRTPVILPIRSPLTTLLFVFWFLVLVVRRGLLTSFFLFVAQISTLNYPPSFVCSSFIQNHAACLDPRPPAIRTRSRPNPPTVPFNSQPIFLKPDSVTAMVVLAINSATLIPSYGDLYLHQHNPVIGGRTIPRAYPGCMLIAAWALPTGLGPMVYFGRINCEYNIVPRDTSTVADVVFQHVLQAPFGSECW